MSTDRTRVMVLFLFATGCLGDRLPGLNECSAELDGIFACDLGETCCDGVCIEANTDDQCGSCDAACTAGTHCLQALDDSWSCAEDCSVDPGSCVAPAICCPPDLRFDPAPQTCVDPLASDPLNCGGCGISCLDDPYADTCCGGGCSDLVSDPNNCGACGTVCDADKLCESGACACLAGQTECDGTCRDLLFDPSNCGACGLSCGDGEICDNGNCACSPGSGCGPLGAETCCTTGQACFFTAADGTCCNPGETGYTDLQGVVHCCVAPTFGCIDFYGSFSCCSP